MTDPARTSRSYVISPLVRVMWRSSACVQLELGRRRVQLDGVDRAVLQQLAPQRGAEDHDRQYRNRERPPARRTPSDEAGDAAVHWHPETLRSLLDDGFLWPRDGERRDIDGADARRIPPAPRLQGELATMTVHHGVDAAAILGRRRSTRVVVTGDGVLGPQLVGLLAAAGVGHVTLTDPRPARLRHLSPGGGVPGDEGRPLDAVAADAAERAASGVDTTPPAYGVRPDLVVLADDQPIDDERRQALHSRSCAHLVVACSPAAAVVGPLVVPGVSSCLRCADLHRLDRDPGWSGLAVQLARPLRAEAGLAAAYGCVAAGLAAMQVADFLDGRRPAAMDGTLELHPPDWRVRRRSWPTHPDCDCWTDPGATGTAGTMDR